MHKSILSALFAAFVVLTVVSQSFAQPNAEAFFVSGTEHLNSGRFEQAIAEFSRAIQLDPRFVNAYNNRGIAYKRLNQLDRSIADFTKGISIDPKDADLFSNRASVYALQKNYDRAEMDYSEAIRLAPREIKQYYRRGDMRLDQSRFDAAIADYSTIISIDPGESGAYLNRGVALIKLGKVLDAFADYRRAIAAYTKEIERSPRNVDAYFNRGIAYGNLEEYAAAIADFTAAINIDPKAQNAIYERANAYEATMQFDRAKADRRRYTELGGTRPTPQPRRGFYSTAVFDPEAARAAFGRGNSAIQGIVCTRYGGAVYRARGARVSLFPVTPYLDEWYKLREKKEGKDRAIFMSNEAVSYRIDVIANAEGRFYFFDLKPGRYFIQVFHNFTSRHSGRADRGSSTEMINGVLTTTNYYEDYDYTVGHANRIEKFVEIKADGEEQKVTLMKGGGLLKLGGCG
ncbi:MAG: tetratricopeptide repeat protein [Acidobacteria bacterium]|nr:tetratricopeptide repeat protein [Acidobacteriota bacterium]